MKHCLLYFELFPLMYRLRLQGSEADILQNTAFSWCTRLLTRRIKWPVMLSVFKQPLQEKGSKLLIFNKSRKLRNWMGFFIAEITGMLALLCMTVLRSSGSLCHG
jgi:hypothetical protein